MDLAPPVNPPLALQGFHLLRIFKLSIRVYQTHMSQSTCIELRNLDREIH